MEDLKLKHFSDTVTGKVRKANEDAIGSANSDEIKDNGNLFIVCDGMGGHVGGAIASNDAVARIKEYFTLQYHADPINALSESIKFANEQIFLKSQIEPHLKGMGTTCTVLLQRENKIFIAHVGDSRIYINSDKELSRITKDHSYVQGLVDINQISDAQMETHPRKNELTRAIGIAQNVNVEVSDRPILAKKGDQFLMCSDGLCGLVNDLTISSTLSNHSDITKAGKELINLALNAGGNDNISIDLIEVLESPNKVSKFIHKNNVKVSLSGTQPIEIAPEVHVTPFIKKYKTVLISFLALLIIGIPSLLFLGGDGDVDVSVTEIKGCMISTASNYDKTATYEDGSCEGYSEITEESVKYTINSGEGFKAATNEMRIAVEEAGGDYEEDKKFIKYFINNGKNKLSWKEATNRYLGPNGETIHAGDYFELIFSDIVIKDECKANIKKWKKDRYQSNKISWAKLIDSKKCGRNYYKYSEEDLELEEKRKNEDANIKTFKANNPTAILLKNKIGKAKGDNVNFYAKGGKHGGKKEKYNIEKINFKDNELGRLEKEKVSYFVPKPVPEVEVTEVVVDEVVVDEVVVPEVVVDPEQKSGEETDPQKIIRLEQEGFKKYKLKWDANILDQDKVGSQFYYKYSTKDEKLYKKYQKEMIAITKFKSTFKNRVIEINDRKPSTKPVWFFNNNHVKLKKDNNILSQKFEDWEIVKLKIQDNKIPRDYRYYLTKEKN